MSPCCMSSLLQCRPPSSALLRAPPPDLVTPNMTSWSSLRSVSWKPVESKFQLYLIQSCDMSYYKSSHIFIFLLAMYDDCVRCYWIPEFLWRWLKSSLPKLRGGRAVEGWARSFVDNVKCEIIDFIHWIMIDFYFVILLLVMNVLCN